MTRLDAIREAQADLAHDPTDPRLIVHRDFDGRHEDTELCWCCPHVFTREEALRLSARAIEAECARREARN